MATEPSIGPGVEDGDPLAEYRGKGKPDCEWCHGTGVVEDEMDYGTTPWGDWQSVWIEQPCQCVGIADEMTTAEAHAILQAAGYDPVEVGRRGAAVAALVMLAQLEDGNNGD